MKEKLAVFDVDGTLYDGNLGIEFLKVLINKEVFNKETGNNIFGWYGKYKNGEIEKSIAVDEIYKLYAQGMKNMTTEKVNKVVNETWPLIKNNLYNFAPKVVQTLKEDGYTGLLISGSPIEMVQKLGDSLQIDRQNIVAGTLEIVDEIYTGNIVSYPGSAEKKVEELDKLIKRRNLDVDWPGSVGIGDNERDLGILTRVGYAIAFNPNDKLANKANEKRWTIANADTVSDTINKWIEPRKYYSTNFLN